jgi:hypothetical protein
VKIDEASPISKITINIIKPGTSITVETSLAVLVFPDLGCPRKVTPKALVKQKRASPPISVSPVILATRIKDI